MPIAESTWIHTLRERFRIESLRAEQQRVVSRLLDADHRKRNALVVLPTGAGKSLCYQLPALLLRERAGAGTTLVLSPLIALMEDQVASLRRRGIAAEYVNSTVPRREREARYARLAAGELELIYVTPERMHVREFADALRRTPGGVPLLAVDEAHCISKWGHDLRPAYAEVGAFRTALGGPATVALTATATAAVRDDIRRVLGLDEGAMPLFASGIDRPNLRLEAREVWSDAEKLDAIIATAREAGGVGIVYFSLIKALEAMSDQLRRALPGVDHAIYHGRLDGAEKKRVYQRFMRASAERPLLLCATNAFGMGVDKPDLRWIVHAQAPGSVEAYYQEVGRAGRDGVPSVCLLLYHQDDLAIQQEFVAWANPDAGLLAGIMATAEARYAGEGRGHGSFDADEIRVDVIGKGHAHGQGGGRVEYALTALESLGVIERDGPAARYRFIRPLRDDELDAEAIMEKRRRDLLRLLDVVKLVRSGDVRAFVLGYFDLPG